MLFILSVNINNFCLNTNFVHTMLSIHLLFYATFDDVNINRPFKTILAFVIGIK